MGRLHKALRPETFDGLKLKFKKFLRDIDIMPYQSMLCFRELEDKLIDCMMDIEMDKNAFEYYLENKDDA